MIEPILAIQPFELGAHFAAQWLNSIEDVHENVIKSREHDFCGGHLTLLHHELK
jgi:hypothetical protein